jgi:uncharacterized protein
LGDPSGSPLLTTIIFFTMIKSRCVKICKLNEASVCVGCGRTLEELGRWMRATEEERMRINEMSEKRLRKLNER